MRSIVRTSTCALLLACAGLAFAQASRPDVSGEWQPMTEQNDRLFRQAEAGFNIAVAEAKQKAEEARRPDHTPDRQERDASNEAPVERKKSDDGPLQEGGMSGPMGPDSLGPNRARKKDHWLTLEELLPPTLDFAAPRSGGLILQRTSTSVLFGRTDSDEMVMLPLSGEDTDIIHGMRASIHEVDGILRLAVNMPTGTQVLFEYHPDPDPLKHELGVDIRIGGGPPGTGVELKRLYRQAQVKVGAPRKAE